MPSSARSMTMEILEAPASRPGTSRRFTYVDLLRGLAAVAVLLNHYRFFYSSVPGSLIPTWDVSRQPWAAWLSPLYTEGAAAVPLFWMLSGLVFAATYGDSSKPLSARQFLVARVARLYPLHFITLLVVGGLQLLSSHWIGHHQIYEHNDIYHFLLNLPMASNWGFERGYSFNGPIWSVSVEIIIYAAFFAYVKLVRLGWGSSLSLVIAFAILRAAGLTTIAGCGMCFFIGVLLFLASNAIEKWASRTTFLIALAGFASFCLLMGFRSATPKSLWTVLTYLALALLLLSVIACDLRLPQVPKQLHWIGEITYSTYLLHIPVIIAGLLIIQGFQLSSALPDSPIFLLGYLAVVISLSLLTYRAVELPLQRVIRRRFTLSGRAS